MKLNEYQCNKEQHLNESIIGYCLNSDCKETRQYCQKCFLDPKIHNQCKFYCQDFEQILNNVQSQLDYLQYQISVLTFKLKVVYNQWMSIIKMIKDQQEVLQQIINFLKDHKYQDLKKCQPQIIQYQQVFAKDKKLMQFSNGLRLAKKGDIQDAIKQFDEIIKNDEKYGNSYYQKGLLLLKLDKIDEEQLLQEAVFCFDKATKIDIYHYDAYKQQGICLFKLKKYDQALNCFNSAIKYGRYDEELYFYQGRVLQENDQNCKAIDIFDQILQDNSYHYDSYYQKSLCLFNLKNYKEAIVQLDKVIILNPTYVQAYILKGQALLKLEMKNEARQCFTEAIQIDPKNQQAYLEKSQTYDSYKHKISTIMQALDSGIQSSELIYEKGFALQQEKKYNQAIEQYNKIVDNSLNKKYMDMFYFNKGKYIKYNLGLTLYKLKRYEEAKDCFIKASYVESQQIEALFNQGKLLQKLSKHQEAIQCFDEVINKGFQCEKTYYKKGKSLFLLGIHIQAIICFDLAIKKCEKLAKVYKLKSECLRFLGKNIDANKCLEIAKKLEEEKQAVKKNESAMMSTYQSNNVSKILKHN